MNKETFETKRFLFTSGKKEGIFFTIISTTFVVQIIVK